MGLITGMFSECECMFYILFYFIFFQVEMNGLLGICENENMAAMVIYSMYICMYVCMQQTTKKLTGTVSNNIFKYKQQRERQTDRERERETQRTICI